MAPKTQLPASDEHIAARAQLASALKSIREREAEIAENEKSARSGWEMKSALENKIASLAKELDAAKDHLPGTLGKIRNDAVPASWPIREIENNIEDARLDLEHVQNALDVLAEKIRSLREVHYRLVSFLHTDISEVILTSPQVRQLNAQLEALQQLSASIQEQLDFAQSALSYSTSDFKLAADGAAAEDQVWLASIYRLRENPDAELPSIAELEGFDSSRLLAGAD